MDQFKCNLSNYNNAFNVSNFKDLDLSAFDVEKYMKWASRQFRIIECVQNTTTNSKKTISFCNMKPCYSSDNLAISRLVSLLGITTTVELSVTQ